MNISSLSVELSPESFTCKYLINDNYEFDINLKSDRVIYRRGKFNFIDSKYSKIPDLKLDYRIFNQDIENLFKHNESINKYTDIFLSKLESLKIAKKVNLKFPKTIIADNWEHVNSSFNGEIITKQIHETSSRVFYKNTLFNCSICTTKVDKNKIITKFAPSLFQEYIEKKYEIRTFYLKGIFKSMAIFSQNNVKTKIDFRNYDYSKPNRFVPYKLPLNIENKLKKLMKILNLNCGSIDLILTPENEYYFLEVNPIGQFQWLSKNCNYFIERYIAIDLNK